MTEDTSRHARSRSLSRPSRSSSRSPSRQRRPSMTSRQSSSQVNKRCFEGFIFANQYEGPYSKHIAAITHAGTAAVVVGMVMALVGFTMSVDTNLDPLKVTSIAVLIIGLSISVSTTVVYTRAHKNGRLGTSGRLILNSQDILLKIALSFTIFLALSGIVIVPLSFSLSSSVPIFDYLKYVGMGYIVIGIIGFICISVCGRIWTKKRTSRRTTQQISQTTRLPRSRTNSEVVPEIRIEEHHSDTGSEIGTGSDITEAFSRRASLVTPSFVTSTTAMEPPPYCETDPHPGAMSDTGSSVLAVSATHSMVTLPQYAYADELDIPPPPYTEADQYVTVSVTPVRELNDEQLGAVGPAQDSGAGGGAAAGAGGGGQRTEQLRSPSATSIGLGSTAQSRSNTRCSSGMLVGGQTETSSALTVPDV